MKRWVGRDFRRMMVDDDATLESVVASLARSRVRFVLIGGMAARSLGSGAQTRDVDICHDRSTKNLRRLARALRALDARMNVATMGPRGFEESLVSPRASHLRGLEGYSFSTRHGRIDCLGVLCTGDDFSTLALHSRPIAVGGEPVLVPTVDALMRLLRATGERRQRSHADALSRRTIAAARVEIGAGT